MLDRERLQVGSRHEEVGEGGDSCQHGTASRESLVDFQTSINRPAQNSDLGKLRRMEERYRAEQSNSKGLPKRWSKEKEEEEEEEEKENRYLRIRYVSNEPRDPF